MASPGIIRRPRLPGLPAQLHQQTGQGQRQPLPRQPVPVGTYYFCHESLDTLQHYVKLHVTDLRETHHKTHPRERAEEERGS